MKFRAVVVPAAVMLALAGGALAGCAPEATPAPSASASANIQNPSTSPSPSPTAKQLVLPEDCDVLVPLATVHSEFSAEFESIFIAADLGDADTQSFAARNGLTCLWGIPNSDAGFVSVYAAVRATASDELQVAKWTARAYSECPPFLDACYFEDVKNEIGEVWTVHALVEGFELRIQATSVSIDPLLVVAREAATNMGYV